MLENHYKYILLGGGVASSAAADAIRERDPVGSILLVGREVNRPYDRPRLISHHLKGLGGRMEIIARPPDWFSQRNIELRTGCRAAHLETARQTVALDSGEEIAFDKLLIATGASARTLDVPGATLPNLFSLRTLQDADRLHHAIVKALAEGMRHSHGRGTVVVVGGGVLGVELASVFTQIGLKVELVVQSTHPWSRFAGREAGGTLTRCLEKRGVVVHLNQTVARLMGDGRVQGAVLNGGIEIRCDFVVAALGILPSKEILRGTPIRSEKAILTDEHGRTNLPNIYAAGDCAAIFDPLFAKYRLIDHWETARKTGAIAGANMAGDNIAYDAVDHFSSTLFDLQISCWGEPRLVHRRHVRGTMNLDALDFVEIGVALDGRIAQIVAINHASDDATLQALVRQRVNVAAAEQTLTDPNQPLQRLLA